MPLEEVAGLAPESRVTVELDGGRILVESNYRDRDLVKQVPGHSFDRKRKQWFVRKSWPACVQLRTVFGQRLRIGPELNEWAQLEAQRIDRALKLRDAEDISPEYSTYLGIENAELYPRQRVGVAFLQHAQFALLGDEVGAGKTRQIIHALKARNALPAIIVGTKSGKDAWIDEFPMVAPELRVVNIDGPANKRRQQFAEDADVYVIHWDLLRHHSRLSGYGYLKLKDDEKELKELNHLGARAVVLDEAHRMQDPKAKQTRAAWALCDGVPDEDDCMRVAATGTALPNHMGNLWSVMRALAPNEWPSKTQFLDRYALQTWSPFGFTEIAGVKPERKDEFFQVLDPRFIRRPTKIVWPEYLEPRFLPPREVNLKGKQKKAYEAMRDDLLAQVDGGIIMAKNPLQQLTRLRQFAAAYAELTTDPEKPDELHVKLQEPSVVVDELLDLLTGDFEGLQTLIFSESRQLMEIASARMAKENVDHALITGMVGPGDRTARREAFQRGEIRHLGLTMGAGGESLTLTAADAVIYLERSFSLIKNKQSLGRAVRVGQTTRVMVQDIVVQDTVYEDALEAYAAKGLNLEEIMRDEETIRRALDRKIR